MKPEDREDGEGFFRDPGLNFRNPELLEFLAYWIAKRGARQFPARADILPREIIHLLPWVQMYDVIEGGKEFQIRLEGTALSKLIGSKTLCGKPLSTLPAGVFKRMQTALNWVLEASAPIRTDAAQTTIPGQERYGIEACFAPLSDNGSDINIIIAVSILEKHK